MGIMSESKHFELKLIHTLEDIMDANNIQIIELSEEQYKGSATIRILYDSEDAYLETITFERTWIY